MLAALFASVGFVLVLFLPGFVLSLMLFRSLGPIDRFSLSVGLSIVIVACLAILLSSTVGMTLINVWMSLIAVIVALTLAYVIAR